MRLDVIVHRRDAKDAEVKFFKCDFVFNNYNQPATTIQFDSLIQKGKSLFPLRSLCLCGELLN